MVKNKIIANKKLSTFLEEYDFIKKGSTWCLRKNSMTPEI
ncbi:MAG: hypothetical protein UV95_C0002G0065 [Candidatus Falkowbacteria bacterium GW2011_GWF2_43_32]|nr:MAG: hypothetical protein UV95_C0002G0065 [Candidatus Falkowbacteria bacterium GW2011_GWF2_43_32]